MIFENLIFPLIAGIGIMVLAKDEFDMALWLIGFYGVIIITLLLIAKIKKMRTFRNDKA